MVATACAFVLLPSLLAALAADPAPTATPADSTARPPRLVRSFPAIEVRAPLYDLRSSQTVHGIPAQTLKTAPVDGLADLLALQPGVVVQGGELHVRGGRAGETFLTLQGVTLNEPLRQRAIELPLLALAGADLVSGAPESRHVGSLAGVIDLRTIDPDTTRSAGWRWQTDGGLDTRYDRLSGRLSTPLGFSGLGVAAAGDVLLDDTCLPDLRTPVRRKVAGVEVGWRAENRLLGFFKVAPTRGPQRFSLQVVASRQVHRPFDPQWSLDGWSQPATDPKAPPLYSPVPLPGYQRWRAADHLAITDDREVATVLSLANFGARRHGTASLGWVRSRGLISVSGKRESGNVIHRPFYDDFVRDDPFHVLWGDYPLYRESGSDVFTLRGDEEVAAAQGWNFKFGAGATYESVSMLEKEWLSYGFMPEANTPLDSVRSYRAYAPGAFAYGQGRWTMEGMVLNLGLRGEYFTAGPQADRQSLSEGKSGFVSLSPSLGIAYPITTRDVFSLAYLRLHQAPGRDYLYDDRGTINNRQPYGNPALEPSTMISYETAVKHVFSPSTALQGALFYRDIFGQVGARDYTVPGGLTDQRYVNTDDGHTLGFEASLLYSDGASRRLEFHYTWMNAWGNESRPEGDPQAQLIGAKTPPIGEYPLSWDRRQSILMGASWPWNDRVAVSWSTAIGSPLPWTPKPRRKPLTDLSVTGSRRLGWSESTSLDVRWTPRRAFGLTFGLEARNLFNTVSERAATVDGYPHPAINTTFDDYGAYRTETGNGGGAYWSFADGKAPAHWVPVGDPRLLNPPRTVRASVGTRW